MPAFDAAFKGLEDVMSEVSDSIEANASQLEAASGQNEQISQIVNWGGLGLILALVASLVAFSQRYVTRPMVDMTAGLKRLSEGDLNVDAKAHQKIAELSELAQVLRVFREALKSREELAEQADVAARGNVTRISESAALNASIADVVGAAIQGDFSRRVDGRFSSEEMTTLAKSINDLVATMDQVIAETGVVLAALAETDLTKRMSGQYSGAIGKLRDDTNAVADGLTEIVGQLRNTSRGLKVATGEILAGANDLSERTTKQAATIEETSATMEQLAHTVSENAKRADQAHARRRLSRRPPKTRAKS